MPTRYHHVANGTFTARLIESAGIPGTRSIWADPLYEGPVPGGLTDAELLVVRARHLGGSSAQGSEDTVNDLRAWRAAIDGHGSYDELILWFEHDLFDQLNLIQLVTWIRGHVPVTKTVSLVCVGSFPGHPAFKGLGELAPDELLTLLDTRRRVEEPHYQLADRAWQAFRASTPEALHDLRGADTAVLPFLEPALSRFLQEYPWTVDGLSKTERGLLQLAAAPGMDLSTALPRMHDGEDVYYPTDRTLAALARELSLTSPPLLTLWPAAGPGATIDQTTNVVALTDTGRAILGGRQDRIAVCGLNRWLGGVHLRSDCPSWRWDDSRHAVIRLH